MIPSKEDDELVDEYIRNTLHPRAAEHVTTTTRHGLAFAFAVARFKERDRVLAIIERTCGCNCIARRVAHQLLENDGGCKPVHDGSAIVGFTT